MASLGFPLGSAGTVSCMQLWMLVASTVQIRTVFLIVNSGSRTRLRSVRTPASLHLPATTTHPPTSTIWILPATTWMRH
jgi:hypothetical protein